MYISKMEAEYLVDKFKDSDILEEKQLVEDLRNEMNKYEEACNAIGDKHLVFMSDKFMHTCGFSDSYMFFNNIFAPSYELVDTIKDKSYKYNSDDELEEIISTNNLPIRICSICGAPMSSGYTDEEGNFYAHNDLEFHRYMDETYGKDGWRAEPTGDKEWNYEVKTDDGWTPSIEYWTEWE